MLCLIFNLLFDKIKVSNQRFIGGLYFSIANTKRQILWQTMHKYLISLLPHGTDPQKALVFLLNDIKYQDITDN